MKKSKLFLKAGAALLAFGLIVFCCCLTFSFTGNPLVMLMAKSTAKHYVEEKYPELDLNVVEVNYNFKFSVYSVMVSASPESEDTTFYVATHDGMNVTYDTYKTDIEQRGNTLSRLSGEYTSKVMSSVEIISGVREAYIIFDWYTDQSEIDYDDFPLDLPFSIQAIRHMNGTLNIQIVCETLTAEEAARIAKEVQEILAKRDMEPAYYSFYFEDKHRIGGISTANYAAEELRKMNQNELAAEIEEANWESLENIKTETEAFPSSIEE